MHTLAADREDGQPRTQPAAQPVASRGVEEVEARACISLTQGTTPPVTFKGYVLGSIYEAPFRLYTRRLL